MFEPPPAIAGGDRAKRLGRGICQRLERFGRTRRSVRPGKAGPKGEMDENLMKFGTSSSGCETRPAKGEPAQPVASLATVAVTRPAMRRRASAWAVGNAATKLRSSRVSRVLNGPKTTAALAKLGEGESRPAGCTTTARSKRTVQAPGRPTYLLRRQPVRRGPGDHTPTRCALVDARAAGRRHASGSAQKKRPRRGRPLARRNRSRG